MKGSFIPPDNIREVRDLTRLIKTYTETTADYKRRIHKLFITANIKIDSVVSDLFGKTGRNLINILCTKTDISIEEIQENASGSLKSKVKELHASIQGFFKDHHRFQLIGMMDTIATLEAQIKAINQRVSKLTQEHEDLLNRLDAIPGIDKKSAQAIIGEIGITLEEFACVAAFVSWAGLCPGNNESAGKRKSGRSPVRNHPLKTLLIQVAWAAIKTKGSYYKAKYYKLKAKRGAKKAIVAIAHRIGKAIYNIIKNGDTYRDLGEDFLTGSEKERAIYNLKKKADALGYNVVPCTA
ncbi:transposase (fragment) [Desulfamplus magnetovallimortis]|uniref:Transposase n=1 Tax=Desulfamplus magnetovallimortis TaxID=1246637 RepID=A0A1W1HEH9_9BACT